MSAGTCKHAAPGCDYPAGECGGACAVASESVAVPLAIVALVSMNKREALVLNRPLSFIYEPDGRGGFIGSDGPFRDVLAYSRGHGRFVAFAGRELTLQMRDGSVTKVKDHWWHSHLKGYESATYSDVETLKKCYVFYGGACIEPSDLAALRAAYTGCVYPYGDYEKVIKYDDMRKRLSSRLYHEEARRKSLIAAIKAKHRDLLAARGVHL